MRENGRCNTAVSAGMENPYLVDSAVIVILACPCHRGHFVGKAIKGGIGRPHRRWNLVVKEALYVADGRGSSGSAFARRSKLQRGRFMVTFGLSIKK